MTVLAGLLRIPGFFIITGLYIIICFVGTLLIRSGGAQRAFLSRVTSTGCRIALRLFNISFTVVGAEERLDQNRNWLVAANHVSYLDILILSSIFRSLYITSVEVQKTFFLGMMSRFGGSLFVERRSKSKLLQEIETIAAVLQEGIPITLFPEGTSSNGDGVLPFKPSLFSAVEKAQVDVQPVCIKYRLIDGKPVSPENRDRVYYYGHLSFFPQLVKLFFVRSVRGTVTFLEPVRTAGRERKEMVEEVYGKIAGEYKKVNS